MALAGCAADDQTYSEIHAVLDAATQPMDPATQAVQLFGRYKKAPPQYRRTEMSDRSFGARYLLGAILACVFLFSGAGLPSKAMAQTASAGLSQEIVPEDGICETRGSGETWRCF